MDCKCPKCGATFKHEQFTEKSQCPHCETKMNPLKLQNEVYLKINWDLLRVIAAYGQRWRHTITPQNKTEQDFIDVFDSTIKTLESKKMPHQKSIIDSYAVEYLQNQKNTSIPSPFAFLFGNDQEL